MPACFSKTETAEACCADVGSSEVPPPSPTCERLWEIAQKHLGQVLSEYDMMPNEWLVEEECGPVARGMLRVFVGTMFEDTAAVETTLRTPWALLLLEPWPLFGAFALQRKVKFLGQGGVTSNTVIASPPGICGDPAYHGSLMRAVLATGTHLPPVSSALSSMGFVGESPSCRSARATVRLHLALVAWRLADENGAADREAFREVRDLVADAQSELLGLPDLSRAMVVDAWPVAELLHLLWQAVQGAGQRAPRGPHAARGREGVDCTRAVELAMRVLPGGVMMDAGAGTCPCREAVMGARPDIRYLTQDFGGFSAEAGVDPIAAGRLLDGGYCKPLDLVSDIADIPLPNRSLDAIYCSNVLEHVPDGVRVMEEFDRLLRPGGSVFLELPFGGGLHNLPFHYVAGYTHQFFQHYADRLGMEVVDARYCFSPWSTDALRLEDLWNRFGTCVPPHRQMTLASAVTAAITMIVTEIQTCGRHDRSGSRTCVQAVGARDGASPPPSLEMLFPDSISVLLKKPASEAGTANGAAADKALCLSIERLDGLHCMGLFGIQLGGGVGPEACRQACCSHTSCEIWQFNPKYGCFIGPASYCLSSDIRNPNDFFEASVGERIRVLPPADDAPRPEDERRAPLPELVTGGRDPTNLPKSVHMSNIGGMHCCFVAMDGIAAISRSLDETILLRLLPPGDDVEIVEPCWSKTRTPTKCCLVMHPAATARGMLGIDSARNQACWPERSAEWYRACCIEARIVSGSGRMVSYPNLHLAFRAPLSSGWARSEVLEWPIDLPERAAVEAEQKRWRFGVHPASPLCPELGTYSVRWGENVSALQVATSNQQYNTKSALVLLDVLVSGGVKSDGTFVNIGAGDCRGTEHSWDPLYQLLFESRWGPGFVGVALEANAGALLACARLAATSPSAPRRLVPVHAEADPGTVRELLLEHGAPVFPWLAAAPRRESRSAPAPLDFLVVDIDSWDCAVAREVLGLARAKIVYLEVAYQIPPPFRFAREHSPSASAFRSAYSNSRYIASAGCSLSYATWMMAELGYYLLFIHESDAVFVAKELASVFEDAFRMKLPQDEVSCYRQSLLWVHDTISPKYIREWFFTLRPEDMLRHVAGNFSAMSVVEGFSDVPFTLTI